MSYVSQFDDITAAREAKLELEFLASHDDLTGLITRGALLRKLDRMTHIADSNRATAAVLFIDVDRLKMINDTYGHAAGDAVLVAVANRLQTTIRENDVVGRIGGDEFVVVMPGINSLPVAANLAERSFGCSTHRFTSPARTSSPRSASVPPWPTHRVQPSAHFGRLIVPLTG